MFTTQYRDQVRDFVLQLAETDNRVAAGAVVGSLAHNEGDRWSDLDLTFSVADPIPVSEVLDDWTGRITGAFGAVQLFDLPSGTSIYRVFLLPGCLQFDLSLTPASSYGATGPNFKLLFGNAVEKPHIQPRRRVSFSVTRSTTRYAPGFVSNEGATGRQSIGSAARATMRSVSPAGAEGYLYFTDAGMISFPLIRSTDLLVHW